ncbi:DUF4386 domain-containing protein [Hyphococcus flavus]|uniref:DUF4386 domain-containing protein n=1 Tax=Hyphococcus flavus TaxID=1866326 RepID=A0AAE9ZFI6_9PROT|nr:DUF4386 domain-containing protein [Hyphococcus flavus]WDI32017.1 DUF4386 domain-containing protein [Hyphococcus flavus]
MPQHDLISAPKAYARFAGFNYLIIFVLAIFANFFILSKLVVSGDPVATLANIRQDESLFRLGVACFFIVLLADIFIAWALYLLLKGVNPHISLLAALFRLTYTVAQIGVVLNLTKALELADASASVAAMDIWPHFYIGAHNTEFTLTLIFFGVHLALLGYLIMRSSFLPTIIGVLVTVAGAGYIIDGFSEALFGGGGPLAGLGIYIVVLPALLGEGVLCLWLLFVGVNSKKWDAAYE